MQSGLVLAIYLSCLVLAVIGGVAYARDRSTGTLALGACVVVELVVLAQAVWAVVAVVRGTHPAEQATFIGYLAGVVFVLPVAAFWSLAERSRWNGVVLGVAALTVAFMTLRLQQMWQVTGG